MQTNISATRNCPNCGLAVLRLAKVCQHCHHGLKPPFKAIPLPPITGEELRKKKVIK